ncbi:MAG: hypothetical protein K6G64_06665 [Eubacterium sp.]|nr:hypothetical protein [Eubacterium sp.]
MKFTIGAVGVAAAVVTGAAPLGAAVGVLAGAMLGGAAMNAGIYAAGAFFGYHDFSWKEMGKTAIDGAADGALFAGVGMIAKSVVHGVKNSKTIKNFIADETGGEINLSKFGKKNEKAISRTNKTDFYVTPDGETIPASGYRYFARDPLALANAKNGNILAKTDGTYFSFDKFDDAIIAQGKLQIPYRPEYCASFDTFDIIDDIHIPYGEWGSANYLEPITTSFKKYGPGKATQAITYSEINSVKRINKLR